MNFFPMFLRMEDRDVVIVGGGETAAQKARLILKSRARVTVFANDICEELAGFSAAGRISHSRERLTKSTFEDVALVFLASECPGLDASVHALARAAGALVNVVDQPHLCEATTPSIVDRRPLVVAIGTEGSAPILGRQIKTRIEELLEPNLGRFARLAGRLRPSVAASVPRAERRAFWRWVFSGAPRLMFASGQEAEAAEAVGTAIGAHGAPEGEEMGLVSLLPFSSRMSDLLTIRAVQRLQEADLVIHQRGDAPLLEMARRDAERFEMPDSMNASKRAMAAASEGQRVVWLVPQKHLAGGRKLLTCEFEVVPCVPPLPP